MSDTPTPETDSFAIKFKTTCGEKYWAPVEFARKLERERDEAMEALDKMSAYIQKITGSCPYECFDAEPHSHPCSEVCDNFTDKINECWKKHFLNQTFFKSRGNKQQTD